MTDDSFAESRARFLSATGAEVTATLIAWVARLSDTPARWAATLEVLRGLGIDPEGYESFENGRHLAIQARELPEVAA